ncbi:uncharacterized protein BKA78DRAFT_76139 [Phyllosticta capitalensis]|uniref:uncharacterized protein n=1 Tax=Phyllosticta capitalensis TaxID=121624 RepID=UPI00312EBF58
MHVRDGLVVGMTMTTKEHDQKNGGCARLKKASGAAVAVGRMASVAAEELAKSRSGGVVRFLYAARPARAPDPWLVALAGAPPFAVESRPPASPRGERGASDWLRRCRFSPSLCARSGKCESSPSSSAETNAHRSTAPLDPGQDDKLQPSPYFFSPVSLLPIPVFLHRMPSA